MIIISVVLINCIYHNKILIGQRKFHVVVGALVNPPVVESEISQSQTPDIISQNLKTNNRPLKKMEDKKKNKYVICCKGLNVA